MVRKGLKHKKLKKKKKKKMSVGLSFYYKTTMYILKFTFITLS